MTQIVGILVKNAIVGVNLYCLSGYNHETLKSAVYSMFGIESVTLLEFDSVEDNGPGIIVSDSLHTKLIAWIPLSSVIGTIADKDIE